jgi:hypothetical protein
MAVMNDRITNATFGIRRVRAGDPPQEFDQASSMAPSNRRHGTGCAT